MDGRLPDGELLCGCGGFDGTRPISGQKKGGGTYPIQFNTPAHTQLLYASESGGQQGEGDDETLSVLCRRLWDRAVAHQPQQHAAAAASTLLRGGSTSTQQPQQPPQEHDSHKPFFGPWHFGSGRSRGGVDGDGDGDGMGPLGTSGEFATFKVRDREIRGPHVERTIDSVSWCHGPHRNHNHNHTNEQDPDDVLNLCVALGCVVCAAMAAGLTIGLMSIDPLELEIKQRVGTAEECRQASVVLPLIQRHHLLLVTLLLYNSAANETLPLFLDRLVPSYVAVLLSVSLVLVFGEILPSALFSGPNQLRIAARLANFVWFLMLVLAPLSYPLAWLLDRWFGHHNPRKVGR